MRSRLKKIILNLSLNLNLIVKMMNPQLGAEVRFLLLPFISNLIRGFYPVRKPQHLCWGWWK